MQTISSGLAFVRAIPSENGRTSNRHSWEDSSSVTGPVLLRPEEVPKDLICLICMTLPVKPVVISSCEHLFCKDCLQQALQTQSSCPVDRSPCGASQVQPLREGSLPYRIWSSVPVKCEKHDSGCAWTGSIAEYSNHQSSCTFAEDANGRSSAQVTALQRKLESCQADLENLKLQNAALIGIVQEMGQQLDSRPEVPHLFRGTYDFNRHNVVELSQLISRYLESKPNKIDRNRIFNCVRNCYMDLQKDYSDNPPHYYMDMRMLLATCRASTWFSDNQRSQITKWMREQRWF